MGTNGILVSNDGNVSQVAFENYDPADIELIESFGAGENGLDLEHLLDAHGLEVYQLTKDNGAVLIVGESPAISAAKKARPAISLTEEQARNLAKSARMFGNKP